MGSTLIGTKYQEKNILQKMFSKDVGGPIYLEGSSSIVGEKDNYRNKMLGNILSNKIKNKEGFIFIDIGTNKNDKDTLDEKDQLRDDFFNSLIENERNEYFDYINFNTRSKTICFNPLLGSHQDIIKLLMDIVDLRHENRVGGQAYSVMKGVAKTLVKLRDSDFLKHLEPSNIITFDILVKYTLLENIVNLYSFAKNKIDRGDISIIEEYLIDIDVPLNPGFIEFQKSSLEQNFKIHEAWKKQLSFLDKYKSVFFNGVSIDIRKTLKENRILYISLPSLEDPEMLAIFASIVFSMIEDAIDNIYISEHKKNFNIFLDDFDLYGETNVIKLFFKARTIGAPVHIVLNDVTKINKYKDKLREIIQTKIFLNISPIGNGSPEITANFFFNQEEIRSIEREYKTKINLLLKKLKAPIGLYHKEGKALYFNIKK